MNRFPQLSLSSAARLLTVGLEGTRLSDDLRRLLDLGVSGVILFRRNIVSSDQAAELVGRIKDRAPQGVYVGTDQEGGLVQRFRAGFARLPPLRALGETQDASLAFRMGAAVGRELRTVGVDVNFAPVLDVDTNPQNPVIGRRSLGSDPNLVAALGVAFGQGLESVGVASCGKHFPGHGDTVHDSHLSLPRLAHGLGRLHAVELVPFRAWSAGGLASLMTAHVVFEALDRDVPATMSPRALGLLRKELSYDGVVFSDDLEMRAISDHFGVPFAAESSVRAGIDNILVCQGLDRAVEVIAHLEERSQQDEAFCETVQHASQRMARFVERWSQSSITSDPSAHQNAEEVVREVLARAGNDGLPGIDPTEAWHGPGASKAKDT